MNLELQRKQRKNRESSPRLTDILSLPGKVRDIGGVATRGGVAAKRSPGKPLPALGILKGRRVGGRSGVRRGGEPPAAPEAVTRRVSRGVTQGPIGCRSRSHAWTRARESRARRWGLGRSSAPTSGFPQRAGRAETPCRRTRARGRSRGTRRRGCRWRRRRTEACCWRWRRGWGDGHARSTLRVIPNQTWLGSVYFGRASLKFQAPIYVGSAYRNLFLETMKSVFKNRKKRF